VDPDQLSQLLQGRRAGRITQEALTSWVDAHADAAGGRLKRTTYLKLRRGDPQPAFLECLAACHTCSQVYQDGEFRDYHDFEQCDGRLRSASGVFTPVPAPAWYTAPANILGGEVLYQCQQCEAVWRLILPERAQRGGWCRVG